MIYEAVPWHKKRSRDQIARRGRQCFSGKPLTGIQSAQGPSSHVGRAAEEGASMESDAHRSAKWR
jgi:hypothetical protein